MIEKIKDDILLKVYDTKTEKYGVITIENDYIYIYVFDKDEKFLYKTEDVLFTASDILNFLRDVKMNPAFRFELNDIYQELINELYKNKIIEESDIFKLN